MGEGSLLAESSSIRRLLNQQVRRGNTSSYENDYATLPRALTTLDRGNLFRSMVCPIFLLYVDGQNATGGFRSITDMLPSEEPGIYGPCARPDHRQRAAQSRENHCHRLIASACQSDPDLHRCDERSRRWSP